MRRASTILRMIDNLDAELYQNYSDEQIKVALEKEEKKSPFIGSSSGLISVISSSIDYLYEDNDDDEE